MAEDDELWGMRAMHVGRHNYLTPGVAEMMLATAQPCTLQTLNEQCKAAAIGTAAGAAHTLTK